MKTQDEWETPQPFYDELNDEFDFNIDPCANHNNFRCQYNMTKEGLFIRTGEGFIKDNDIDGLNQDWYCHGSINGNVFVNPPYSRGNIEKWVHKSYEESQKGCTVVMLLPVATGTTIWHEIIFPYAEIRFLQGRIKFLLNGKVQGTPRFDSAIVIFRPPRVQGKFKYASVRIEV